MLTLPLLGLGLALGLSRRPAWYDPASVDYRLLDDDKRAELELENRISAALNSNHAVEITLDQQQVNRWIAARHELWPGELPELERLSGPQVCFLDGNRIRLAATARHGRWSAVVSVVVTLRVNGQHLEARWGLPRAGVIPVPGLRLEQWLSRLKLPCVELDSGRVVLSAEGVWPNGRRRFRVDAVEVHDGKLRVRLVPLF